MMRRAAPQGDATDPPEDDDTPKNPSGAQAKAPAAAASDSDPDEFESAVEEQELPFNVNSMVLLSKGGFGAAYYARLKNSLPVVVKVARVGEDGSARGVANSEVWVSFAITHLPTFGDIPFLTRRSSISSLIDAQLALLTPHHPDPTGRLRDGAHVLRGHV